MHFYTKLDLVYPALSSAFYCGLGAFPYQKMFYSLIHSLCCNFNFSEKNHQKCFTLSAEPEVLLSLNSQSKKRPASNNASWSYSRTSDLKYQLQIFLFEKTNHLKHIRFQIRQGIVNYMVGIMVFYREPTSLFRLHNTFQSIDRLPSLRIQ